MVLGNGAAFPPLLFGVELPFRSPFKSVVLLCSQFWEVALPFHTMRQVKKTSAKAHEKPENEENKTTIEKHVRKKKHQRFQKSTSRSTTQLKKLFSLLPRQRSRSHGEKKKSGAQRPCACRIFVLTTDTQHSLHTHPHTQHQILKR